MDIIALLACLAPYVKRTTLRQMVTVVPAILAMTGRITMLGISRWTKKGGSYRTVQRFYHTVMPWALLFWTFFRTHLWAEGDVHILAGDECVVPKAGKHTYGLDRFFSSLYSKPIAGLAFFTLSLVNTRTRQSHPVQVEQMIKEECGKQVSRSRKARQQRKKGPQKAARQRPLGRPKGSRNRDKTKVTLTPELQLIQNMVRKQLLLIGSLLHVEYLVLDGHFGNNHALQMVRQCGLHMISKMRKDAALYFRYAGPVKQRKYGDKVDYSRIPARYLRASETEGNIRTDYYQAILWHKLYPHALNVVIIVKTNLQTGARAHVVLFSSDLDLSYEKLVDYYGLRFQIEFNFRDAKQHWGLDDFMNVNEIPVTNAANLSLFMVNVSHALLADFRQRRPHAGVLDLKSFFCGRRYVDATLELLPEKPDHILLGYIYDEITALGSIHRAPAPINSS